MYCRRPHLHFPVLRVVQSIKEVTNISNRKKTYEMAQWWQRGHRSPATSKALHHQVFLQESFIFAVISSTPIHPSIYYNPPSAPIILPKGHSPRSPMTSLLTNLLTPFNPYLIVLSAAFDMMTTPFFPKIVSSSRSNVISWVSFCLTACFSGALFRGWSPHRECSVLGFLSISLHIFPWGSHLFPCFRCHLDGGGFTIFNLQPWFLPELRVRLSKCFLEANLDASLFTSGSRAKFNLSSFLPRHTVFCHV